MVNANEKLSELEHIIGTALALETRRIKQSPFDIGTLPTMPAKFLGGVGILYGTITGFGIGVRLFEAIINNYSPHHDSPEIFVSAYLAATAIIVGVGVISGVAGAVLGYAAPLPFAVYQKSRRVKNQLTALEKGHPDESESIRQYLKLC